MASDQFIIVDQILIRYSLIRKMNPLVSILSTDKSRNFYSTHFTMQIRRPQRKVFILSVRLYLHIIIFSIGSLLLPLGVGKTRGVARKVPRSVGWGGVGVAAGCSAGCVTGRRRC